MIFFFFNFFFSFSKSFDGQKESKKMFFNFFKKQKKNWEKKGDGMAIYLLRDNVAHLHTGCWAHPLRLNWAEVLIIIMKEGLYDTHGNRLDIVNVGSYADK